MNDKKRTFQQIARDIEASWKNVYFGAKPYLEILLQYDTTDPRAVFLADSLESVALYFLANAQTFRGEKARQLKAELKSLINT